MADLSAPHSANDVRFTVSIGVTTLDGEEDTAQAMFSRAESNLKGAKQRGGDAIQGGE